MNDELMNKVVDYLWEETRRQNQKWGEQNHPLVRKQYQRDVYEANAIDWKERNADRVKNDLIAWDGILLEEVYEALEAVDEDEQIAELVQVAAVALQAAASIIRNRKK